MTKIVPKIVQRQPCKKDYPKSPIYQFLNLSSFRLELLLFQFKRKIKMAMVLAIHINETKNLVMVQFFLKEKLV